MTSWSTTDGARLDAGAHDAVIGNEGAPGELPYSGPEEEKGEQEKKWEITLRLAEPMYNSLVAAKEMTGVRTFSKLIRRAISLYIGIAHLIDEGKEIYIEDPSNPAFRQQLHLS